MSAVATLPKCESLRRMSNFWRKPEAALALLKIPASDASGHDGLRISSGIFHKIERFDLRESISLNF
jgi:hypothetical protein